MPFSQLIYLYKHFLHDFLAIVFWYHLLSVLETKQGFDTPYVVHSLWVKEVHYIRTRGPFQIQLRNPTLDPFQKTNNVWTVLIL
jgi:hypothetical protein